MLFFLFCNFSCKSTNSCFCNYAKSFNKYIERFIDYNFNWFLYNLGQGKDTGHLISLGYRVLHTLRTGDGIPADEQQLNKHLNVKQIGDYKQEYMHCIISSYLCFVKIIGSLFN